MKKKDKLSAPPTFSILAVISHRDQARLRHYTSLLACLLSCLMFIPATIVSYFDERSFIFTVSLIANILMFSGAACIFFTRFYLAPMYLIFTGTITLGIYMTSQGSVAGNGNLLWLTLLPYLSILTLGRKHGSIIFFLAFATVLGIFLPPIEDFWPFKYTLLEKIWVLTVMLACWAFAWTAEFARFKTKEQLVDVVTHLEHYAFTDTLTEIGNRREFENTFIRENALFLRKNKPFAIIMFDLDHFKAINDRYGHNAGDAVLVHTARLLRRFLRTSDQVCRWGGEEFTALLPDITRAEAVDIAERIRENVEATPCIYENNTIYYTISAGVYLCTEDLPLEKHIQQVDGLLYKAKKNGRNQIQFESQSERANGLPAGYSSL